MDGDFPDTMIWGSNNNAEVPEFLTKAYFKQQGLTALDSENEDESKIDQNADVAAIMAEI